MDDEMLNEQTDTTLHKLEAFEKNWHIFKSVILIIGVVVIVSFTIFETNKTVRQVSNDNRRTRALISCVVPAFTPQNYTKASDIVNKCIEVNQ